MSRAMRRASRPPGSRSRRTPVRPSGGGGLRVPWIPIAVLIGIAAVVGVVIYLVIQTGKPPSNRFEEAADWEATGAADPNLPGEYVNLPQIYADGSTLAHYGQDSSVGPNTAEHVTRDVDYTDQGLPPVGGPHWGGGSCGADPKNASAFCGPAPSGIYRDPWQAETLIHNMEHAGVVIWYNTTDQETISQLEDFAKDNDDKNLVLAPLPELEPETIAITVWSRRDKFPVSEFSRDRLDNFLDKLYCRFDPEGFC